MEHPYLSFADAVARRKSGTFISLPFSQKGELKNAFGKGHLKILQKRNTLIRHGTETNFGIASLQIFCIVIQSPSAEKYCYSWNKTCNTDRGSSFSNSEEGSRHLFNKHL
ncbi:hypothetical protein CEXT_40191 [Caerostris extrusa]|uniref:Uncharacterized protein n=1 Tax=Caerostris extrusa TaxID=172846 RepID=A0AAV4UNR7_CAEEX|nr:hypothetical protein CEXT_40191 [Caerostris extrusa]